MKEILEEYGKVILVSMVTIAIVTIITGISVYGNEGIVDIAGFGEEKLLQEDVNNENSYSGKALDVQSKIPAVNIRIGYNPTVGEHIYLSDVLLTDSKVNLQLEGIYIVQDGEYKDASTTVPVLADYDRAGITFYSADVYYLEVSVWEEYRLSKRILRINVEEK